MVKKQKGSEDEEKIFALLCYLVSIIGVIIVLATKKDRTEFSIFHAKQGIVLFVAEVIMSVINVVITAVTFGFGWFIGSILWVLVLILVIIGILNSLAGKQVPLPLIGHYGESMKL